MAIRTKAAATTQTANDRDKIDEALLFFPGEVGGDLLTRCRASTLDAAGQLLKSNVDSRFDIRVHVAPPKTVGYPTQNPEQAAIDDIKEKYFAFPAALANRLDAMTATEVRAYFDMLETNGFAQRYRADGHLPTERSSARATTRAPLLQGREREELDRGMGIARSTAARPHVNGSGQFVLPTVRPSELRARSSR